MAKDLKRRIVAEFSAKNRAKGEMAGFRRDMDTTGRAMKRMASGALAAAGLGGGLYALKGAFDYVTKAAMKQEDALFLLEAALKTAGEYSVGTMRKFEEFAASIQQLTVYGDEEVLALMQLMKSLGVTSNSLEQATRMAIGLAAATGRDVRSMSMYIALAQQGEFTMLRRYIPALRSTTDATEQLRIITEFAAAGFEIAKAKAETASGAIQQMKNAYSDVAEIIGDAFLPSMKTVSKRQKIFLEENKVVLRDYLVLVAEGAEMMDWLTRKMAEYSPPVLIYKAFTKPEEKKGMPALVGGIVRFEEPGWLKATLALNVMTEAQKKAAVSMYEMSMKARGLSKELAREKKITEFAALAKVRYAADVAGAQAAEERFARALEETEAAQIAASDKAIVDAARDRIAAIRSMDFATRTERIQNLEAYVAANEDALVRVAEANKILKDEITALERDKWAGVKQWGRDARDIYLQLDQIAVNSFDRMANALTDLCLRGKADFGALAQSVLSNLTRMIIKMQMAQLLGFGGGGVPMWFSAGVGGALGGLGGGPPAGTRIQNVPGTISATYLQGGGEVVKTGWAKVHKGETYSGVGRGEVGGVTVNVNNDGMEKFEVSQAAEYWAGDQRVVDIFITRAQTDGGLRRAIKDAAK